MWQSFSAFLILFLLMQYSYIYVGHSLGIFALLHTRSWPLVSVFMAMLVYSTKC